MNETVVFDHAAVLDRLGGDEELFAEIRDLFLSDGPDMVAAVREAARSGDPRDLERSAHGLKGALLSLAAAPAAGVALELERAGREGDVAATGDLLDRLDAEVGRLLRNLRECGTS